MNSLDVRPEYDGGYTIGLEVLITIGLEELIDDSTEYRHEFWIPFAHKNRSVQLMLLVFMSREISIKSLIKGVFFQIYSALL